MKTNLKIGFIWFFIALSSKVLALPPEITKSLQKTSVLVVTEKNVDDIWKLRPGDNQITPHYVILDLDRNKLEDDMVPVIRQYVQDGHGLIISLRNNNETVVPEIECGALCDCVDKVTLTRINETTDHLVLTGVKTIFVRARIGNFCLSKVKNGNNGTPFFRSKDNYECVDVYLKELGKGRIALFSPFISDIPIIQNESLLKEVDNNRFAVNLDQWLAGFPVPGASGGTAQVDNALTPDLDIISLKNGDILKGEITDKFFTIKTSYTIVSFKVNEISEIKFEGGGAKTDIIFLRTGDSFSGILTHKSVTMTIASGSWVQIDNDKLNEITFYLRK